MAPGIGMLAAMQGDTPNIPQPKVGLGKTLRRATRQSWDSLGLVCAASLTLFAACVPVALFWYLLAPFGAVRWLGGLLVAALTVAPLTAGLHYLVHQIVERDEPTYLDMWRGARQLYGRAAGLGAIQLGVQGVLAVSVWFYTSRGVFLLTALGALCLYLLVFWWAMCLYQWPLLVAGETGLLERDEGRRTTAFSAVRNSALLTLSSPFYSLGLLALLLVVLIPLLVSGVGMALLGGGFAAFAGTQAARDQLVRFGAIPPPPDTEGPAPDEPWRVRDDR